DGTRSFPAYPVQAVDSTAAGDAFAGALAVGLAEGYNLENAISWAQQAAAVSVTRMGAQPSLPTRKELMAYHF
ncbi:ribokinase, partial [bacterium]|nr:ribokinase [bacterium]